MKCKKCGTKFREGVFCPECGTKVVSAKEDVNFETMTMGEELSSKNSKKKQKGPKIAIIFIALIATFVLIGMFVFSDNKKAPVKGAFYYIPYRLSSTMLKTASDIPKICIFVNFSLKTTAEQIADSTRIAPFSAAA